MTKNKHFVSENFGFSVLGHLVVLGLVVFLAEVVMFGGERFVAPDRIQITMIDLNQVRVAGDETVLYNTNTVADNEEPKAKEPEQTPEHVAANEAHAPV